MPIEWSAIVTAVMVGMLGYLWRQNQRIEQLHQALFGVHGKNGLRHRMEEQEASLDTRAGAAASSAAGRELLSQIAALQKEVDTLSRWKEDVTNRRKR